MERIDYILYEGGYDTEYGYVYNNLLADEMLDGMKAMQVCKPGENEYDYVLIQVPCNHAYGCYYYYNIKDNEREISLYSDKIESDVIDARDAKELFKLFDWVSDETFKNLEKSEDFNFLQLYMYILVKSAQDEDFKTWWSDYNFKISYKYDRQGFKYMKMIKG